MNYICSVQYNIILTVVHCILYFITFIIKEAVPFLNIYISEYFRLDPTSLVDIGNDGVCRQTVVVDISRQHAMVSRWDKEINKVPVVSTQVSHAPQRDASITAVSV